MSYWGQRTRTLRRWKAPAQTTQDGPDVWYEKSRDVRGQFCRTGPADPLAAGSDVYVTPYLNRMQVTSDTLSYATGLGRIDPLCPCGGIARRWGRGHRSVP